MTSVDRRAAARRTPTRPADGAGGGARPRAPRRNRTPARALAAIVLLVVLALVTAPSGADAQAPSAQTPAAQAPTAGTGRIELRGQTPFVAPRDTLEMKIALRDVPADATLSFELQFPITNKFDARAQLDSAIAGKGQARLQDPKTVPIAFVPTDPDGVVTVKLEVTQEGPDPQFGFKLADGGVYPLIVTVAGGDGAALGSFTTYLIRLPGGAPTPDAPALKVAGILPFRAPLAINTAGESTLDADGIKRLSEITRIARAHDTTPLTVAANPETVAALGLLGTRSAGSAPGDLAAAWAGHEVLSPTFVPVDVDAWVASAMTGELAQQLRLGHETLAAPAANATPFDQHTWLADPALSAAGMRELHATGRDRAVLPPQSVAPLDPKTYPPELAQIVDLEPFDIETDGVRTRAVVTDDQFRARFSATANPALNAQIAMADLAVLYFGAERPLSTGGSAPSTRPRSVTAVLPEDLKSLATVDAFLTALERPTAALLAGGGRPIFEAATIDTVLMGEPAPANPTAPRTTPQTTPPTAAPTTRAPATPTPSSAAPTTSTRGSAPAAPSTSAAPAETTLPAAPALVRTYTPSGSLGEPTMGSYPARLAAARVSLAGYDSMVRTTAPQLVTPLEQLIDVSGSAQLNAQQRQAYLDSATGQVADAADKVRPLPQENLTIAASEADLSFPIQNDNAYPVAVRLSLSSDKMQFPVGDQAPSTSRSFVTTLQPGANKVPVRVSTNTSGEIQVSSKLTSPDENIVLAESKLTVRSTLISGLGLALSIGAGFFLLLWWGRNIRKTRRAHKLVPPEDLPDAAGAADPTDEGAAGGNPQRALRV